MYEGMHGEAVAVTMGRRVMLEVSPGKTRLSVSALGTVTGWWEDLGGDAVSRTGGAVASLDGRLYADRSQDLGYRRGDLAAFADPATGEERHLVVDDRRGPFDASDDEDHFELDMVSEQRVQRVG